MSESVVYMCHPVSGDVLANVARAKRWLRWACDHYPALAPVMPWLAYVELYAGDDDSDEEARELSIRRSCAAAAASDTVWLVGGRISSGMEAEARAARRAGVQVWDLSGIGDEPPDGRVGCATGRARIWWGT